MERTPEMLAGLLAIMKTGGAYLPLDPDFPRARLALILEDARPEALLTQGNLLPLLPTSVSNIVLCDARGTKESDASPEITQSISNDDLVYVIYTSGSTGKPKGVEVTHLAVVNLLAAMQQEPGFTAADVLLAVTTLSFDIAALELFLPLVTGGRVVLAEREVAADPRRLAELIRLSGCTVMQATPATWGALVEAGWLGSNKLKILCGGEALSRELADQLLSRGSSIWNMYGPTETTIWSVVHKVRPGVGPLPIGRPIANTRTYLLDALGNPVPVGLAGDLYIGGTGLARGYRHREELTRDCFVTCPAVPGERLYRTGDLARYRDDGLLEFLGRTDQQLKISRLPHRPGRNRSRPDRASGYRIGGCKSMAGAVRRTEPRRVLRACRLARAGGR